jgi:hypothetical protein
MDDKAALLKDEYLLLLKFYEDFDARLIIIKGWSVTVSLTAIGLGFQNAKPALWLFGAGAALIFWILEGTWKSFQYSYSFRIQEIETAFRTGDFAAVVPLQTYSRWYDGWRRRQWLRTMALPIVWVPHALTAIAGVTLFLSGANR